MLIYCPECHTLVAPDWHNCRYCGAPVDKAPARDATPIYAAPPPELGDRPGPSRWLASVHRAASRATAVAGTARARAQSELPGLRRVPWLASGGLVVASVALTGAVCAATQTGDQSMFSAKDRYLAAYELLTTPTATPAATSTVPATTGVQASSASDATETEPPAIEMTGTPASEAEPVVDQVAPFAAEEGDDDGGGGDNGRGRGRGRGRDGRGGEED